MPIKLGVSDELTFTINSSSSSAIYVKEVSVTYKDTYTVTYAKGHNEATGTMTDSNSPYIAGATVTLLTNTFEREGYDFAGWSVKDSSNDDVTVTNNQFTMPAKNVTVTALWTASSSDPYFTASDVTIGKAETNKLLSYTVNNPVTGGVVSAAIKTSSPSGWLTVGAIAEPTAASSTVPLSCSANIIGQRTATVTLTYKNSGEETLTTKDVSVTQDPATYTVTYYANSGTGDPVVDGPYEYGTDVNAITNTFIAPAKKQFAWWGDNELGDEDIYDEGDPITGASGITGNIVLYAIWEVLPTYSLVTSTDQIVPGAHYIIASSKDVTGELVYDYAMGEQSGNTRPGVQIKVKSGTPNYIEAVTGIKEVVISGPDANGKWTMYDEDGVEISSTTYHFIASTSGNNNYITATDGSTDNAKWSIGFDETSGQVKLTAASGSKNLLKMNDSSHAFTCYGSSSSGVSWGYLYRKDNDSNIHPYSTSEYSSGDDVTISDDITLSDTYKLTIGNGAIVRFTGTLATANATNLIIEDGGQLIASNSVAATVKKTIANAGAKDASEHWYTIASPVNDGTNNYIGINNTNTVNLTADSYDMFAYDEKAGMWLNQKEGSGANGFDKMYKGQGYLYRNSGNELSFVGNTNSGEVTYTLKKENTGDLAGFNLIGNPYPHDINLKHITYSSGDNLVGFYRLSNAGAWGSELGETEPIHSYEGFLVQADVDDKVATFHETAQRGAKSNGDNIKFIVANSQYEDVAYALFDKGFGLSKINHRNAAIPMLYINQEDADYAIATMSDDTKSFNLNFKAMTTGKYTLSYKATGTYSYLHVIDRLTGEDVDMLLEGEYSFIASPSDAENRFIVRLEYSAGSESQESSVFAYQSGNDIIVNGEGELQIFDMMGRRVLTQYVSGVETINLQLNGVYIFRLNEKTQKIVVK